MKNLILFTLMLLLACPSVNAMKVYNYDSNGKRVYHDVVSKYGTNKKFMKTSYSKINTPDYDPKAAAYINGTTTFVYDANGQRTKRIKRTGDGRVYVYDANGQRIKSYKKVSNRTLYNSRVNRTSYRVQPSGSFYR